MDDYDKKLMQDGELRALASKALRAAGLAWPENPLVLCDVLRLVGCVEADTRRGILTPEEATAYGEDWTSSRPYYLNALRWADLTLWRSNSCATAYKANHHATPADVQGMIDFFVADAYGSLAYCAAITVRKYMADEVNE